MNTLQREAHPTPKPGFARKSRGAVLPSLPGSHFSNRNTTWRKKAQRNLAGQPAGNGQLLRPWPPTSRRLRLRGVPSRMNGRGTTTSGLAIGGVVLTDPPIASQAQAEPVRQARPRGSPLWRRSGTNSRSSMRGCLRTPAARTLAGRSLVPSFYTKSVEHPSCGAPDGFEFRFLTLCTPAIGKSLRAKCPAKPHVLALSSAVRSFDLKHRPKEIDDEQGCFAFGAKSYD